LYNWSISVSVSWRFISSFDAPLSIKSLSKFFRWSLCNSLNFSNFVFSFLSGFGSGFGSVFGGVVVLNNSWYREGIGHFVFHSFQEVFAYINREILASGNAIYYHLRDYFVLFDESGVEVSFDSIFEVNIILVPKEGV
jgi:hypothetical protein